MDVRHSDWDCTLEPDRRGAFALRMGLGLVRGFNQDAARRIAEARAAQAFADVADLCRTRRAGQPRA